jgi:predicted ATP-dependent endonuclease of OLD family
MMITKLQIKKGSKHRDLERIQRHTPQVLSLLKKGLSFSPATIIIGENGTGKSLLLTLLALSLHPKDSEGDNFAPEDLLYNVAHERGFSGNCFDEELLVEVDPSWQVLYHAGLNPRASEITDRMFGSSGEGSLYELLVRTSDIKKYYKALPALSKGCITGTELIAYFTSITKLFTKGVLELEQRDNAVLLTDEPEASLSPMRVGAMMRYFTDWVLKGNQIIMATNHPWLIEKWAPRHNAQIIDLGE